MPAPKNVLLPDQSARKPIEAKALFTLACLLKPKSAIFEPSTAPIAPHGLALIAWLRAASTETVCQAGFLAKACRLMYLAIN